ncbi:MAG: pyridoxal phosphate-dependent aminotransferase family protein [Brumimicrobium sp.]
MTKELHQQLASKLEQRKSNGNLRKLNNYEGFTDFFSNDYLGLGRGSKKLETSYDYIGSARLIAGNTPFHTALEEKCATLFNSASSLLFNTGYSANLGVLSSIPQKDDLILYDEFSHASIKDGIRLSLAKAFKFKHNDVSDLTKKLENNKYANVFVVIEGLYSMGGDLAPIEEISKCCKGFNANLIIDEAHSGGVYGQNGSGLCSTYNLDNVFLRIFTFGKAFGAHGACVVADKIVIDYLINFARSFIYTTALPKVIVKHISNQLERKDFQSKQEQLQDIVKYFNVTFNALNISADQTSPIKTIQFSSPSHLKEIESKLHKEKFGVKAIYSPTVPKGNERLRISLHAHNTKTEINRLLELILG